MRYWRLSLLVMGAFVLAAGCDTTSESETGIEPQVTATPEQPKARDDGPAIPAFGNEEPQTLTPWATNLPLEPVPELSSLMGLAVPEIIALLGNPQFQRMDAPAELWQYRQNGCVLDLFLYPSSTGLSVDHLETRHLKTASGDAQECFAAMVRTARATSG